MKNIHAGHRDRLREKWLNNGIETLEDHEILETLLSFVVPYKDMNPAGHELLNKFGSIHNALNATKEELVTINDIADKTAKYIMILSQFAKYYPTLDVKEKKVELKNRSASYHYCAKLVGRLEHEEFYVICLDNDSRVIATEKFTSKKSNKVNIDPPTIAQFVASKKCTNVLVCHNHPHGKCEPSDADNETTRRLFITLSVNGILMLDHIIVGANNSCFSYRSTTLFEEWKEKLTKILSDDQLATLNAKAISYDFYM